MIISNLFGPIRKSSSREMVQGRLLPVEVQQQVLTYIEQKKKPEWIINKLGISKSTFYNIKSLGKLKYNNEYKTKTGRKEKISKSQKMSLLKELKKNPRISLKKLGNKLNLKASTSTISRQLGKSDVHRRKLRKIPTLNARHKLERYNYALTYCNPKYDWSKWIWTDEKKFNLDGPDGYNYYWHTKGQPPLKYSSNASSKKSIMVWGGISKSGQTKLVKVNGLLDAKKYCELLKEGLHPL